MSVHAPPVGVVTEPQVIIAPTTASNPKIPSTVIICEVLVAVNLYQIAFSVPLVQSPVSLLSVAPIVEPVVLVVQIKLGFTIKGIALLQMSFDAV